MMREVLLTGHVEEIEGAEFLLRGDSANDSEACRIAQRREDAVIVMSTRSGIQSVRATTGSMGSCMLPEPATSTGTLSHDARLSYVPRRGRPIRPWNDS